MSALRISVLTVIMAVFSLNTQARHKPYTSVAQGHGRAAGPSGLAAGCLPPAGSIELDLNNVRTMIQTGGDMWWDLELGQYEVPKNSGKHSIFSGSLWMGGVDVNNQLKVAALAFRANGFDFWPGPLDLANAEIDAYTCNYYDRFFEITRKDVNEFVAFNACILPECDPSEEFPGYTIPDDILNWPAHGDPGLGQDFYLAPFNDTDGSGDYNPEDGGDYPFYDLTANPDCNSSREVKLFGDETLWWVFNDKGNIHTETGASPIGMEIRAQAFAFATNDEVNDMTFMNYELINRGSFTLTNTFFAPWVDPDLGDAEDDYVGCDVGRGLGYCYNGDAFDGATGGGPTQYPDNPPAVGIDFFQGPYQDNDGVDNLGPYTDSTGTLVVPTVSEALADDGIVYRGIGIGYSDDIIDNERFGMRKFVYFTRSDLAPPYGSDPDDASEYYNYMNGIWKDGADFCYGGTGHPSGGCNGLLADYMFPGTSDPLGWGTNGNPQAEWTEESGNNPVGDRRFLQSAGPFTLEPGAVNDITVGVVWAWDAGGSEPFESVVKLQKADDKAQALFDNCFVLIDGPDAPTLEIVELDRELVLVLSNPTTSNNKGESYAAADPFITSPSGVVYDNVFRFEGYQIFQLKDQSVSASDITNPDLARLVGQCDVKNFKDDGEPIAQLVNFTLSEELGANVPQEMVSGQNDGIQHTFQITSDEFATGDRRLVNHKDYYYMAVAYSFNEYKKYDQSDPLLLDGQKKPYLAGRKTPAGTAISPVLGVPHIEGPEREGTIINANYGDGPLITRIEGQGNGGREVFLTTESVNGILASPDHRMQEITYQEGMAPVYVKVYDPFKVPDADFVLKLKDSIDVPGEDFSDGYWTLECVGGDCPVSSTGEPIISWNADKAISLQDGNEQLIEEIGLSIFMEQVTNPGEPDDISNGFISGSINFAHPPFWLTGIPDQDGSTSQNWIMSGTQVNEEDEPIDFAGVDDNQVYESVLNGSMAPYRLSRDLSIDTIQFTGMPAWDGFRSFTRLEDLAGVDIHITSDRDKWSRVPVIEVGRETLFLEGDAKSHGLRMSPSVDKDGESLNDGTFGMSWFPGYAVNVETGERLNMAFGENSWLRDQNGADMIWNPTSEIYDEVFNPSELFFNTLFGGMHFIYVFGHNNDGNDVMPSYDEGQFLFDKLSANDYAPQSNDKRKVYGDCMWVGAPLLEQDTKLLASDVIINLRVTKPFKADLATSWQAEVPENDNLPMYTFNTSNLAVTRGDFATAEDALSDIRVVPNPYFGASGYEVNQLDNVVKIVNLPDVCEISIYTVNGVLVRSFSKASDITSVSWDLKNHAGIPIGSGMYIIHVDAPGIGEKILKWFGTIRQLDLQSF